MVPTILKPVCPLRYTREAGVRSLERKIGAICRAVAVKIAEGHGDVKTEDMTAEGPTQQGGKGPFPQKGSWSTTLTSVPLCIGGEGVLPLKVIITHGKSPQHLLGKISLSTQPGACGERNDER